MNDDCPYCEFKDGMNVKHICIDLIAKEKIDKIADECQGLEDENMELIKLINWVLDNLPYTFWQKNKYRLKVLEMMSLAVNREIRTPMKQEQEK